jgi:hypothetical protein
MASRFFENLYTPYVDQYQTGSDKFLIQTEWTEHTGVANKIV